MTILGFDTSTAAATAAVLRDDGQAFDVAPAAARLSGPPAHAAELLPAVHDAMERAGVGFRDLDCVAVGTGPGSFTGLRIGVATARALCKAGELPLRGVSSLAALAEGIPGRLRLPLIDARRGEVYAALFADDGQTWPPFVARPEELLERVAQTAARPLAAGDGSLRFRDELEAAGVAVVPVESPVNVVSGLSVCRLALRAPDMSPERVLPEYLRDPDAVPNR